MKLIDFLSMNTDDSLKRGVWVNPDNIDEYRIGRLTCHDGGLADGWVLIGRLASLRFCYRGISEKECFHKAKNSLGLEKAHWGAYPNYLEDERDLVPLNREMSRFYREYGKKYAKKFISEELPSLLIGKSRPWLD